MVHLKPLPGSPTFSATDTDIDDVEEAALRDARALASGGADAFLVENFGDAPFHAERVSPVTIAAMTRIVRRIVVEVAEPAGLAVGVNVLRNDAIGALAIAAATGGRFIRVNVHVGAMLTDQGVVEGRAAKTLRRRAALRLGPGSSLPVAILADIGVKHATPLSQGWSLEAEATDAWNRGLADALIISGGGTGEPTPESHLELVRSAVPEASVLIGSGVDEESFAGRLGSADGWIVGSALKDGGDVHSAVTERAVSRLSRLRMG